MAGTKKIIWEPIPERSESSGIRRYMDWLRENKALSFDDYHSLWGWSVANIDDFWESMWQYYGIKAHKEYSAVRNGLGMPNTRFFEGSELNYAEHALARRSADPAIIYRQENGERWVLSYDELRSKVARLAKELQKLGVSKGDRVVGLLTNRPETVIAFLATASLGAIWSSCAPEFGTTSVVDRFGQITPKVLVAVSSYAYAGKRYDISEKVVQICDAIPSIKTLITVGKPGSEESMGLPSTVTTYDFEQLCPPGETIGLTEELEFEEVSFSHPLWILYSSGTTGIPKAIVQGHGGILMEHLKFIDLHLDITVGDRLFWFTTTGWMMWNLLVSGLCVGATIVLYDGSPNYPNWGTLWQMAASERLTCFGTSASFIHACMKEGVEPASLGDLSSLESVGSTGSPLSPEGFSFIVEYVGSSVLPASISGGTDLCTAFVGSVPILPVYEGEIQCRALGAKVEAYDPEGKSLIGEVGELVITEPMPSMPLYLWGDEDGSKMQGSYFEPYPGIWRHGDWIEITERGTCILSGRSDATLNRGGVRMGTAEFYRVTESFTEVTDSLVVDTSRGAQEGELILFVQLAPGANLDDDLRGRLTAEIRSKLSPRHVPDRIVAVEAIPRTLNGKKLEVPIKRILQGADPAKVLSEGALANPESIRAFTEMARSVLG